MAVIDHVIDGIGHWSAPHPRIKQVVHSAYVPSARLVIDPIAVPGLVEEIRSAGGADVIALTNRHHLRDAVALAGELGAEIKAPASGMHEFSDEDHVTAYEWGEEIAPGVTAQEVGAICPDDGALHLAIGPGALALADSAIRHDGALAFVPDFLMDDPGKVKAAQAEALGRLCELEFDTLLLAHGEPIASGGRKALGELAREPRSADFSA